MDTDTALIIEGRRKIKKPHQLMAAPNHFELQMQALREKRLKELGWQRPTEQSHLPS